MVFDPKITSGWVVKGCVSLSGKCAGRISWTAQQDFTQVDPVGGS